jgi:imidazolonepropionase-like amidohydrolase
MKTWDELRYVETLATQWAVDASPSDSALHRNERSWAQFLSAVGAAYAGGVEILAGTDCANAWVLPGFALHDELQLLVDAGLTAAEALAAATVSPARYLGLDDELGTITAGKRADLILLYADPLADIANISRITAVILGGECLGRATLDSLLQEASSASPTRH